MLPSDCIRKGWCQRYFAIDASGRSVPAWHATACAWCFKGAVYASYRYWSDMQRYLNAAEDHVGYVDLWNDTYNRTQADVLALCLLVERELNLIEGGQVHA